MPENGGLNGRPIDVGLANLSFAIRRDQQDVTEAVFAAFFDIQERYLNQGSFVDTKLFSGDFDDSEHVTHLTDTANETADKSCKVYAGTPDLSTRASAGSSLI